MVVAVCEADCDGTAPVHGPAYGAKELHAFGTPSELVARAACCMADVLFVFPLTETGYFGESVVSGARAAGADAEAGVAEHAGRVTLLHGTPSAGSVIHGAVARGLRTAVLTPSTSLAFLLPEVRRLARHHQPAVFHVSAGAVTADLRMLPDHADVMAVRDTGAVLLASSHGQEAYDLAIYAHRLAQEASVPVVHFFDRSRLALEACLVRCLSPAQLRAAAAGVHECGTTKPHAALAACDSAVAVRLARPLDRRYAPFEYYGPPDAGSVLVMAGVDVASFRALLDTINAARADPARRLGVVQVRIVAPWLPGSFGAVLPIGLRRVVVLERQMAGGVLSWGPLYAYVLASIDSAAGCPGPSTAVIGGRLDTTVPFDLRTFAALCDRIDAGRLANGFVIDAVPDADKPIDAVLPRPSAIMRCSVFDADQRATSDAAAMLAQALGYASVRLHTSYLLAGKAGPATLTEMCYTPTRSPPSFSALPAGDSDFVALHDARLMSYFGADSLAAYVRPGGVVVLNDIDRDSAARLIPAGVRRALADRGVTVVLADVGKLASRAVAQLLGQLTQLRRTLPTGVAQRLETVALAALLAAYGVSAGQVSGLSLLRAFVAGDAHHDNAIRQAELAIIDAALAHVVCLSPAQLVELAGSAATATAATKGGEQTGTMSPHMWSLIAPAGRSMHAALAAAHESVGAVPRHRLLWQMLFCEAYDAQQCTAHSSAAYQVRVTANRRLTPVHYDRNVFHMEFDSGAVGLRYGIGDALAVHGHNDAAEVDAFLDFYGLRAADLLLLRPDPAGFGSPKHGTPRVLIRTVEQLFTQHLDLFGRPTRRFYEQLAAHATEATEKERLEWLLSSEGVDEFKRRVAECTTFADVLREFPSAHPPVEALASMLPRIKPRHYSIASSMKMHPDSVHLLVVLHDWVTPGGRSRTGQCSRYLARLPVGATAAVLVRPSVMQLPADPRAPVVMAGLGTGMAPFRAFIEERAWMQAHGEPVGPMALYFGSRHRLMEYLYGEELQAYHAAGVLAHLRLAFSRDQPQKQYIQHHMREDAALLHDYMARRAGSFYLCGPTWPVPEVQDAMIHSLCEAGGQESAAAQRAIADMKKQRRYVLEVY